MAYTFSNIAPECPYCHKPQGHDGGYFYDEDLTEHECDHCERTFRIEVYHSTHWTWTTREAVQ